MKFRCLLMIPSDEYKKCFFSSLISHQLKCLRKSMFPFLSVYVIYLFLLECSFCYLMFPVWWSLAAETPTTRWDRIPFRSIFGKHFLVTDNLAKER